MSRAAADLISEVVALYVEQQLTDYPDGVLRFCMVGFDSYLASSIAGHVHRRVNEVEIHVPPTLASAQLDSALISRESAAYWRNSPPRADNKRAILIAVDTHESQTIGNTLAALTRIDAALLRRLDAEWLRAISLTKELDETERLRFSTLLACIERLNLARTLEMFAAFLSSAADGLERGNVTSVDDAFEKALDQLHLPRGAGVFPMVPSCGKGADAKIRKRVNELRLYMRRRDIRGEILDADYLLSRAREAFETSGITAEQLKTVADYLEDGHVTADSWTKSQAILAAEGWSTLGPIFEGLPSRKKASLPLGEATLLFLREEYADCLGDDDIEFLETVTESRKPSERVLEFFDTHRQKIAQSRNTTTHKKLAAQWEKLVYREPILADDFLIGLFLAVERLVQKATVLPAKLRFVVELPHSEAKSFWQERHNSRISDYLRYRYHGVYRFFESVVDFRLGRMMTHPLEELDPELQPSNAKKFTQFRFDVFIWDEASGKDLRENTVQLLWSIPPDSVATALPDNLKALLKDGNVPICYAQVSTQAVAGAGRDAVDLAHRATIRDVNDGSSALFVADNCVDVGNALASAVAELKQQGVLDHSQSTDILNAFAAFRCSYHEAISEWCAPHGKGIYSTAFLEQAERYGALLRVLRERAYSEKCREMLWRPLLGIGMVYVDDVVQGLAIVTPWAPLRLAELHIKARQISGDLSQVASNPESLAKAKVFFEQVADRVSRPYYGEVIGIGDTKLALLTHSTSLLDFSLLASPEVSSELPDIEGHHPNHVLKQVSKLCDDYLSLLPHERANFSIVHCDAESRQLSSALAEGFASKISQDSALRCVVWLTHTDGRRIRQLYREHNDVTTEDLGATFSNEGGEDFLSRLRTSVVDLDGLPISAPGARQFADVAILENSITRRSSVTWVKAPAVAGAKPSLADFRPTEWTRRKPMARGDGSAVVYLAPQISPLANQAQINLVHDLIHNRDGGSDDWLPARRVSSHDGEIKKLLETLHNVADWVICYDAVADRRLLQNLGVNVLRYISRRDLGFGLTVSTRDPSPFVMRILTKRLQLLMLGQPTSVLEDLARTFIRTALNLSGLIVMRAAHHSVYAAELIGVVLSLVKVRNAFKAENDRHIGWYFLDDFAHWLGQREGEIADILAIRPTVFEDEPVLEIVVVESKFVGCVNYRQAAKKSANQLLETVLSLAAPLEEGRGDRSSWLARLGDLLLEGMEPFSESPVNGWDLLTWSRRVRDGEISVKVTGLSYVFVHDSDVQETFEGELPDHCSQEIVGVSELRRLVARFGGGAEPDWGGFSPSAPPVSGAPQDAQQLGPRSAQVSNGQPATDGDTLAVEVAGPAGDTKAEDMVASQGALFLQNLMPWVEREPGVPVEDSSAVAWLGETRSRMIAALRKYGMAAEVLDQRLTPNAGLFRLKGSDDLTVAKIEKRQQELLTSHSLDIINISPALGEVRVMVRRPSRATLSLYELWSRRSLPATAPLENHSLLLGAKEVDGELLYLNLGGEFAGQSQHGPHTLIAGETGSGKGILTQLLLLELCATNSPKTLRIRFIDPKEGVDYPWLQELPHLDGNIITSHLDAISALEELVSEMDRRYEMFRNVRVSKLKHYNDKVDQAHRLPYIWLFHDELADWMIQDEYRRAVEELVSRLGIKARAAGIHLVFITQRPDNKCFPMQLRANISNRLVLKVSDRRNSELVLDTPGAERLLGRGHLAAKLSGESDIILAQVPYVDDADIWKIAEGIAELHRSATNIMAIGSDAE